MLNSSKKIFSTVVFLMASVLLYSQSPTCNITAINNAMASAGFQPLNVAGFDCALYFYNPNATSSWFTARDQAAAIGATLVTINSQAENDAIWQAGVAAGLTGGLWIGYTDRITEGVWLWEDGSTSTFTNWNPGEPNNTTDICSSSGEDAAIMQMSNGRWNDVYINPGFPCISPASYASLIKVNLCPEVDVNTGAALICEGTSTLLNASTLFGSPAYNYSWTNNSNSQNVGNTESVSVAPQVNTTYTVVSTDRYGCSATNTIDIEVEVCASTCNIPLIQSTMAGAGFQQLNVAGFDCALYYYNPNATSNWFTARNQAAAVGATLVTINSQAENDAIWQAGVAAGLTGGLWIGYTDRITEGVWLWEDGSTSTFTNWNPGEPNNTTDICSSSGEDAAIIQMSNGRWNDVYINPGFPCLSPASYRSLVKVNICPEVTVSASSTNICQGQSTSLSASTLFGSPDYNYSWENVTSGGVAGTGSPLSVSPQSSTIYQVISTDRYECTATESITINVNPSAQTTIDTFLCAGQTILVNGNTYGNGNNSGTEVISLPNGCDSIVVVNVTPLGASDTTASTQSICNGETFVWNGQNINGPGVYYHSISALDSVFPKQNNNPPLLLTANLTAFSSYGFSTPALYSAYGTNGAALPDASPNGFTYEYLNHPFWTGNGVVADRITSILGRWIDGPSNNFVWYGGSATINIPTTQTYYILLAADNEFRFFLDGNLIVSGDGAAILATQPGGNADQVSFRRVHIYPLEIQAGCRVITLEAMNYGGPAMFAGAILNNTAQELIDATSINDLNFVFSTQNETSFYTGTPSFSCPAGSIELGPTDCDSCQVSVCGSVFELTVINNPPATASDVVTACNSFTWINGITYNSSTNTPIFTIPNGAANGCDSIVTLNLTINLPQSGVDIRTACNSFTWLNGVTYNSSTNTPTFSLPNGAANGCDSIVTLNLTINQSSNTQTTVFTCNENEVGVNVQNLLTDAGCDSTHTVTTILDAFVDPLFTSISPVCIGANAPLLQSVSQNNISGSWSPQSINTNLPGTQSFTFIPDNNQCANEVTFEVEIVELPQINLDDYTLNFGTDIQLQPDVTGNAPFTYLWSPADGLSCVNCENPTAMPFQTTQFLLTVADENGCISTDTLTVNVTEGFYIPDAFTPNGDGINDIFVVYGGPFLNFKLQIYNRWGEKIFESNNQNSGWNGLFKNILQNPDVYVYYFEGEIVPGEKIIKKGSLTLIR